MIIDLLGRLHPAVVHFPIGILVLAFILQYLSPKQIRQKSELIWIILIAGALSSVVAAGLGWILSWSGEYAASAVSRHQWPGIYLCVASVLLVYFQKVREKSKLFNQLFHGAFTATMMLLLITVHYGATLTHGSGYLFEDSMDKVQSGEKMATSSEMPGIDSSSMSSSVTLPQLPVPDSGAVNKLKNIGLVVKPLAAGANALEINAVNFTSFSDKDAALLAPLAEQILWLHLADTKITDEAVKQIVLCKNLRRLDLRGTSIGQTAMNEFKALAKLEYLNMVGTSLDDGGLSRFVPPASLTHFYCWNTKVTKAGLDMFKAKYPQVILNEGGN